MEIGVGASTCASGNHVCSGTDGTLMMKPMNSSRNAHHCDATCPDSRSWRRTASSCAAGPVGQGQQVERVDRRLDVWIVLRPTPRVSCDVTQMPQSVALSWLQIAVEVQHQDGDQHQHAADQRVQEELDRRIFAPRPAPDADQEVHRQQHDFPEHVEQEEIERHEHAQHARFQQQEQNAVGFHVLVDRSNLRPSPARSRTRSARPAGS